MLYTWSHYSCRCS